MKKIFILCLLLLISCSKDEAEDPMEAYFKEAIIGSWSYDLLKVNDETYSIQHTDGCTRDYFQFYNQEGKEFDFQEQIVLNCSNCAECATSGTGLRWELEGDIVNMYFGEQFVVRYKIIEITETTFTYQRQLDFDKDGKKETVEITAISYDPYNDFVN
jgi:hypothetical protein